MTRRQPFVDAHHHLQLVSAHPYPWLRPGMPPTVLEGDLALLRRDYSLDDFRHDAANQNLVKSVHVQNGWDPADPVGETSWLQSIADRHGFPHGIVAYADLAAKDVEAVLEVHASHRNLRGIRQILTWSDTPAIHLAARSDLMTDGAWRNGFALLRRYAISFDLQVFPQQFADVMDLGRHFPDVPIILNHAGMPIDRSPSGLAFWADGMSRLAEAPNLSVKISGLRLGNPGADEAAMRPLVLRTIDAFGVSRCMFGSNFPVDRLWAEYDTVLDGYRAITDGFSSAERTALFQTNAERIYRL